MTASATGNSADVAFHAAASLHDQGAGQYRVYEGALRAVIALEAIFDSQAESSENQSISVWVGSPDALLASMSISLADTAGSSLAGSQQLGQPLSGSFQGGSGRDVYQGAVDGTRTTPAAIQQAVIDDAGGVNQLSATAAGFHESAKGIESSQLRFSTGFQRVIVDLPAVGSTVGVSGSSLILGDGGSLMTVNLTAQASGDNRVQVGVSSSNLHAQGGHDVLLIRVSDPTPSGIGTLGTVTAFQAAASMGAGDDQVMLVADNPGRSAAGLVRGVLDLGAGNDSLTIDSTGEGVLAAKLLGGDGADHLLVKAGRI